MNHWLRGLKPVVALCVVGAWLAPGARAQNLYRPPQPPSYTSKEPVEGLLNFQAKAVPGEGQLTTITASWAGMYQVGTIRPPDPHGAAGPNGILQAINLRIAYYTKAGATIWGPVNFSTFWAGVGNTGSGLADPRALFDPATGRFYVILQENTSGNQSFLNLAVSKNSNPTSSGTGDWYFYRLNVTEISGGNYGCDYPGLGFDGQAVYVTYNMYGPMSGGLSGSFKNCQIIVLNKAAITSGTGTYYQVYTPDDYTNGFTLQPATVTGASSPGNIAYFAETPLASSTSVRLWALSDPLGARTLSSAAVTVPNNGGYIDDAPQAGTGETVPTLSNRTQGNAFWYNGAVWFCHTAGGSAGRAIAYYYKVNANSFPSGTPTLGESGGIDGGSGVWTYQVSIGGNALGDIALVYTASSSTTYPTMMCTARRAGASSFDAPVVVNASPGYSNSDRWGDYASVTADPSDNSFWVTHEWARSTALHDWGTWWANIAPPAALAVTPAAGLDASGYQGGPFNPSNKVYTLTNTSGSNLLWTAGSSSSWITIAPTGGTLTTGAPTNVTVSINANANSLGVGTYNATVSFSNVNSGAIQTRTVVLTVQGEIAFDSASYTVSEAGGTALIAVRRDGNTNLAVTVDFATSNGTATAGSDYVATNGMLVFAVGDTVKNFTVPILQDALAEGSETVVLTLGNPTGGGTLGNPSTATLTISDDDIYDDFDPDIDLPQWSAFGGTVGTTVIATDYGGFVSAPNSLWFGDSGSRYAATRSLNTSSGGPMSFWLRFGQGSDPWETADLPGEGVVVEYSGDGGTNWTEFGRYDTTDFYSWTHVSMAIPVAAQGSAMQFRWRQLSNSGTGFDHWALDDVMISPVPPDALTVIPPEGMSSSGFAGGPFSPSDKVYTLTNTGGSNLTWAAECPSSWVTVAPPGGTLTTGAPTNVTVSINANANSLGVGTYNATVSFSNVTSGISQSRPMSLTVRGEIAFDSASYTVSEAGGTALITVRRDGNTNRTVTVDFATSNGTATAGSDYMATNGTLVFAVGDAVKNFTVPILQDALAEGSETVVLTLGNPTGGGTLGNPIVAMLTILDDDIYDDFDPDIDLPQWSAFGGTVGTTVIATNYGGFVSAPNSLWFGDSGSRYAATRSLNTSGGGPMSFWLRFGQGISPWETADLPGEGVVVEYSGDGGTNWTEFGRYDTTDFYSWTHVSMAIPVAAQGSAMQFRWRQLSNSGTGFDHWALDDVMISHVPPDALTVIPPEGMSSSGFAGGPFSPSDKVYTLTNTGGSNLTWAAECPSSWVTVAPPGGTLTAGAPTNVTVSINANANSLGVGTYNATVSFSNVNSEAIQTRTVVLTVQGEIAFDSASYTVSEAGGTALIAVRRDGNTNLAVTVDFATSNGTATAGSDYVATNGMLVFAVGDTDKNFTVPILQDALAEGNETVVLTLGNPTGGGTLGDQQTATLTIVDDDGTPVTLPVSLNDGSGYLWDIQQNGRILNGTSDAYDGGHVLSGFPSFPNGLLVAGGREVVIGSATNAGIVTTRRIYVPTDQAYARFLEVVQNVGPSTVTNMVRLDTNLGSDSSTVIVGTSDGDTTFEINDNWIVTDDADGTGDPTVLHVIANEHGQQRPSGVSYSTGLLGYEYQVVLQPGETKIVMHFGAQSPNRSTATSKAPQLTELDLGVLSGISAADLARIVNFGTPDDLQMTPSDGLNSSGFVGGPFSPSKVYTLANSGGSNLTWAAGSPSNWITIAPTGGTLTAGAPTNITVSINANANSLGVGIYNATVNFSNLNSGVVQTRNVELAVNERVLDHFEWDPIGSTQYVGQAVPVTITARDVNTNVVTGFIGTTEVTGLILGSGATYEDFESGIWPDTPWVVVTAGGSVGSTYAHDGSYGLYNSGWHYRTDVQVGNAGESVSWWIRPDSGSAGRCYLGFAASSGGCWSLVCAPNTGKLMIYENAGWGYISRASVNHTWQAGKWYKVVVEFESVSSVNGKIYDSDGTTLLNSIQYAAVTGLPGGLAIRSFIGISVDTIVGSEWSTIGITPTNTGTFVAGVWTGTVIVQEVATNMHLRADDGSGHTGDGNPFNVLLFFGDTDGDGLPDWWENLYYGGPTNANPLATCSNGCNTVLEAYIAGLDPTEPDARFVLSGLWNELWWDAVSGRVYGVWWSSNLFNGFQPLETNIPWSAGGFTDAAHSNEVKGFYKLKVELE